MNKKTLGPRITIIPSESGDGVSGGISASCSLDGVLKVSRPRVEPLPPRNTAFISVESLQKKSKLEETKKISEEEGEEKSGSALASLAPMTTANIAAVVDDVPAPAGVKSWEDWLAPLGSTEKKQQLQGGGSSKKKARRR